MLYGPRKTDITPLMTTHFETDPYVKHAHEVSFKMLSIQYYYT